MKHVETIRKRWVDGMSREIDRMCGFISSTDGNRSCVELLKGKPKVELIADLTQVFTEHMEHKTQVTRENELGESRSQSQARRFARGSI